MSMTVGEFKENIENLEKINDISNIDNIELKLHIDTEDYKVSSLDFSKSDSTLRIYTTDEIRKHLFRISYTITKDHRLYAFNTVYKMLSSEDDIILNIEEWQKKILHENGIDGEIAKLSGSTVVQEKETQVEIDHETEKAKIVEKDVNHYYNCKILEILKEIDSSNDTYIRVWKDGTVS